MRIEQIYTGCLAHGAYWIESGGEAAVVDPLRDIGAYLERARSRDVRIKYVLETHFHADFVGGHLDLAKQSGAKIVYGPGARPEFEAHIARDGEDLRLGAVTLKVLHTPGHTLESACYLLIDERGKAHSLYTGDTLFIGDVGRPDLAQRIGSLTKEDLAGRLFDSLRTKVMPLPDDVIVYPAHGAGSACGKNMSRETSDTLGHQKEVNYALRAPDKESFVRQVTEGLPPPPAYFPQNVLMNQGRIPSLDALKTRALRPLGPDEMEQVVQAQGALVLDTRPAQVFKDGFVPRSVNIGIRGDFAPWVGCLIPDVKQPLVLIAENGTEEEAVTRLARVGYDNVLGYLSGGFEVWKRSGREVDAIESIGAEEFAKRMAAGALHVVDVRRPGEYATDHVEGAVHAPLQSLNEHLGKFATEDANYVHCASGYRSMVAASLLKARGVHNVIEVAGGFQAIQKTGVKRTRGDSSGTPKN